MNDIKGIIYIVSYINKRKQLSINQRLIEVLHFYRVIPQLKFIFNFQTDG